MQTSSQRWVGIIATFLEFSASLSCIYPPGKSEIIEHVQYFASACEVNQNRGNVFPELNLLLSPWIYLSLYSINPLIETTENDNEVEE